MIVSALIYTALLAPPGAGCPPEPIEAQTVVGVAAQRWDAGAAWSAVRAGRTDSRDAVPGRLQALQFGIAPEFQLTDTPAEYTANAALTVSLGTQQSARRAAFSALYDAQEAQLRAARWQFVEGAIDAFLEWQSAELERRHLAEYMAEAKGALRPLQDAPAGALAKTDLADLSAEVAQIDLEVLENQRRVQGAQAHVQALIGRCPLAIDDGQGAEQPGPENPWRAVEALGAVFPQVEALNQQSKALQAQAAALEAANPWQLQVGIAGRTVAGESQGIGPSLALVIPLAGSGAGAAAARAGGHVADSRARWLSERAQAQLGADATRYDSLKASYDLLSTAYLTPMLRRTELLEQAFGAAQITLDRLLRARRQLHEAEHEQLRLRQALAREHLKARAFKQALTLGMKDTHR